MLGETEHAQSLLDEFAEKKDKAKSPTDNERPTMLPPQGRLTGPRR